VSFAIRSATITGNNSCTFDFSDQNQKIGAFVYGLQQFSLASGSSIPFKPPQSFGLSYSVSPQTGVGYSTVELTQQVASGLNPSYTNAEVIVIAFLGAPYPQNILLGNDDGVAMGGTGKQLTPYTAPAISCAALGGFSCAFASDSDALWGFGAGTGIACIPAAVDVAPVGFGALLGGAGYSGTVDPGYIVLGSMVKPSLYAASLGCKTSTNPYTETFGATLSACAVLIQSFYGQFAVDESDGDPLDFVSLAVSASANLSGQTVSGQVLYSYNGRYWISNPGVWAGATVTSTVGSALVVGIV
jgi:hypothetical protein